VTLERSVTLGNSSIEITPCGTPRGARRAPSLSSAKISDTAFGSISTYVCQVGVEHVWELHLTYLPPSSQSGVTGSTLLTYPPSQHTRN